jgi:polar amino acid transport system substrate-binding protein
MSRSILAGFAAAAVLAFATPAQSEVISIRADEWLPYNGSTSQRPPGYMIEMADRIAAANGHSIDYRHLPWEDSISAVRRGVFDCVVGATRSETPDFAFADAPWGVQEMAAFAVAESDWHYTGIDSLRDVRLAVIPDYSYGEEIDAWIEQNRDDPARILTVTSPGRVAMSAVSRVVTGRADVFIEDRNVMRQILATLNMKGRLTDRGQVAEAEEIFIACSPGRGERWAKLFSEGTQRLRASGELDAILAKYSLVDWLTPE